MGGDADKWLSDLDGILLLHLLVRWKVLPLGAMVPWLELCMLYVPIPQARLKRRWRDLVLRLLAAMFCAGRWLIRPWRRAVFRHDAHSRFWHAALVNSITTYRASIGYSRHGEPIPSIVIATKGM
jgi:hypothetical protein